MTISLRSVGALAATLLALTGCNSLLGVQDLTQSEPDADVSPDAPPGTARVRILHVATGLPAGGLIDVYVDDETTPRLPAIGGLSDYIIVDATSTKIAIRAQGQSGGQPLFEFDNLSFAEGSDTTAVLTGIATSLVPDEAVRLLPITDGYAQAGTGMTQVRFLNAAVDLPTVGLDMDYYGEASPEIAGLARFQSSPAAGIGRVSNELLRFGVVQGGTTVAAFAAGSLPVGVGCLVVLYGKLAEPRDGRDALKAARACRTSTASYFSRAQDSAVIHVLADVPQSTVATLVETPSNRTVAANVGLRQPARFWLSVEDSTDLALAFPSRTVTLGIPHDFGDIGNVVGILGGVLQPGSGENDASTQALFPLSAVPTTGPRVIFFTNMTADVGMVDLTDATNVQLGENVGFSSFSSQSSLPAGGHTLTVAGSGGGGTIAVFPLSVTGPGGATLLVLEGAQTATGTQRPLRLTPIDIGVWPPAVGTPIAPN